MLQLWWQPASVLLRLIVPSQEARRATAADCTRDRTRGVSTRQADGHQVLHTEYDLRCDASTVCPETDSVNICA